MARFSEYNQNIDGITIHMRSTYAPGRQNSGAAFPLVCIHGNLGSGRWFEPLFDRYRGPLIAPDLPNFGQSDSIDSWEIADYADWVERICRTEGITRAAVLGHSLGGAVAMELLARRETLAEQIILVDSAPVDGLVTPESYYPAIEAYRRDKEHLRKALRTVMPAMKDQKLFEALVDDAWQMNPKCFIGHAQALGRANFTSKLSGLSIPALVMYGSQDTLIGEHRARATASFFDAELLIFENCGHSPPVELPEEFAAAIEEFLYRS